MCGIAGFANKNFQANAPETSATVLDRMCRCIAHRGPDDQGTMVDGGVALGMRRLAIIDLAGGAQPIYNEDQSCAIVFNGEIYNFPELQKELQAHGHTFKTSCDTETILHGYEEWGADVVKRLRGMFAFAIWDKRKRELFIARDRVGKKPLYYSLTKQGTLVFGSELKSLLEHNQVERRTSLQAIDAYLALGYVPEPLSIFEDIKKLPPAHTLIFDGDKIVTNRFWDFDYTGRNDESETSISEARFTDFSSEEKVIAELNRLLEEAVRVRLISEVPLGAFLSGGVDSSVVVGLMARVTDTPVKTFSIGFNEDSYNELKYARVTAKHFNTEHHEFIVTPEICGVVEKLVTHFDEPFADSSAIPTFIVSKLAREHVTVVLSGDGGDELFAGYTRYKIDQARSGFGSLPRFVRQGVMLPLSEALPHGARGRNFIRNVALDPLDRYVDSISIFTALARKELCTADFRRSINADERDFTSALMHNYAARATSGDAVDALLYLDSKTYLVGDILTKVDRMTMANSLEARVPLLDHKLIDFVTRIPSKMKLRDGVTKYILKKAAASFVPREILHRPKQGFGVPIDQWINNALRDQIRDTITGQPARARGYINPNYVNVLLDEHERGWRNHSAQLWALFMLEKWHEAFAQAPTCQASAVTPTRNV
ncbi:MAG: asparagine synthase (glutamine-hydrolyzing) [Pyrinomonadaceae bacterium MAG19_C2-C3]|nr:asparagine synthase (glutamine-hydrolyzing) [Pyrinomonadaceae bacterium MAG19_C2-C3]